MNSRELTVAHLPGECEFCDKKYTRIMQAFGHEFAEKIRNSERLRDLTDDHMSDVNAAADEIDPEA